MFSRSIIDDSRSIIDDSRSIIDDPRSIIDDSRIINDTSRVVRKTIVSVAPSYSIVLMTLEVTFTIVRFLQYRPLKTQNKEVSRWMSHSKNVIT
jgi:hypothetical protein